MFPSESNALLWTSFCIISSPFFRLFRANQNLNTFALFVWTPFHPLPPHLTAALLTWNYHVTMPMPASTFTLAVGRWQQVPAEIPSVLEGDVGDGEEQEQPAKLGAGPGRWTEAKCGLGSSTSEVVKGTPPQTGRYWLILPPSPPRAPSCPFFLLLQTVDPRLSPQHSRLLNFPRGKLIGQVTAWAADGGGGKAGSAPSLRLFP